MLGQMMVKANFTLPEDMVFGEAHIISILAYSVMLLIGLTTNTVSLHNLLSERLIQRNRNRMTLLLIHLNIADLIVILLQVFFIYHLKLL